MAPVQCKIRFSVGTAKVSSEGTDSGGGGGVTAGCFGNVYPHTLARTERDGGMMSWVNCRENPACLLAFRLNVRQCDGIGPYCCFRLNECVFRT